MARIGMLISQDRRTARRLNYAEHRHSSSVRAGPPRQQPHHQTDDGFEDFRYARIILSGIEIAHMIRKELMQNDGGTNTAAEQFYFLSCKYSYLFMNSIASLCYRDPTIRLPPIDLRLHICNVQTRIANIAIGELGGNGGVKCPALRGYRRSLDDGWNLACDE
jgi:hypothetical protein